MLLEVLHEQDEDLQRQAGHLGNLTCAIIEQRDTQEVTYSIDELVSIAEGSAAVLQQMVDQLERQDPGARPTGISGAVTRQDGVALTCSAGQYYHYMLPDCHQ
jgi:hypothetical protein